MNQAKIKFAKVHRRITKSIYSLGTRAFVDVNTQYNRSDVNVYFYIVSVYYSTLVISDRIKTKESLVVTSERILILTLP